ncbi:MAG: hypothetical protein K0S08_2117 [Gammaproteobacteria bacterium]|jgi:acyl carrier protein|nr:hypothetical protein [Gammaproteobacteria bacterium]
MHQEILNIVTDSVKQTNQLLKNKAPIEQGENCPLFGSNGYLDSMSLVSLVVSVEEKIEKQFNTPLILADEKAMSQKRSPFATVGTLTTYIEELMREVSHA